MKQLAQQGLTVEEAITRALSKLQVEREQVEIEIVQQPKKGFFGFGAKPAEVIVTVKEINEEEPADAPQVVIQEEMLISEEVDTESEPVVNDLENKVLEEEKKVSLDQLATEYLTKLAKGLKIEDLQVEVQEDGKYIYVQIDSQDAALLIGKRGQTLYAIQQLLQLVVNQHANRFKVVRLNIGDYKERREQSLIQLAERLADQSVRNQRKVKLDPMPSYERKIVHHALAVRVDVDTYSEGEEPYRYLVIEPLQ